MRSVTAVPLLALLAAAVALPRPEPPLRAGVIPILQRTHVQDEAGQFAMSYLSGDGTAHTEQGALKLNSKGDGYVLVKQGTVSYVSPEGIPVQLKYTADEDGFRAHGDHLPVAPLPLAPAGP